MNRGFSLVEALVAIAVLSMGLLGAAGMLLGALRDQARALRHGAAVALVADVADRLRANSHAGDAYDASTPRASEFDCSAAMACDPAELAAHDLAYFEATAQTLLAPQQPRANIVFEPAIGSAAPHRYVISLRWHDVRDQQGADETALVVLTQPVAGGP